MKSRKYQKVLINVLGLIFILMVPCLTAAQSARAFLIDGNGDSVGTVEFTQTDSGVIIIANVHHLPAGTHSIHIHENGSCEPPRFKSAGDHFNPTKTNHGFLNHRGPHAGDLPNIEVTTDGTAHIQIRTRLVTLGKGGKTSILRNGATSVVIHSGADDYVSNPAGKSGDRIACGVIEEIRNSK